MTYGTIILETHGGVAKLTLNRPERLNALNQAMLDEINDALDRVETDETIRALIVTGAGSAFSSGFDLKEQMERRPTGIDTWRGILRKDFDTVIRFWHLSKPTIAAVNGHCLAGACELALACDLTIAADTAVFGEPELKFGAGIVVMILPWLVGPKVAKEIILTGGDRIPADQALRIGMVNRVVPAAELEAAGNEARPSYRRDRPQPCQARRSARSTGLSRSWGWGEALEEALAIDLQIEGHGSPDKIPVHGDRPQPGPAGRPCVARSRFARERG